MAGGANKPAGGGKKTTPAKAVAKAPAALFATKALQAAALKELSGKAGNVDEVRGALIAAAGMSRGLWITFLSLATYLVIAVGAVTHRDLFLENPVRLPLLNVDLPLIAFFWVAPILFLIFHAYLLLHLKLLVDKVRRYSALVAGVGLSDQQEDAVRLQLPNFVFVQLLAAPRDARKGLIGWFLRAIAWITVVVGPIVLLLLIQLQFLPYHHAGVTWIQRIVIVADLILLWLFWPRILMAPDGADAARRLPWRILGSATIVIVGSFSWLLATFPGESADRPRLTAKSGYIGKDGALISVDERLVRPAKKWLFEGKVNEVSGRRESFFLILWCSPTRILSMTIRWQRS